MKAQIRLATAEDASAIARVAAEADLALIDADSPRVRRILDSGRSFVATRQSEVVGFVDGFVTAGAAGERRYELDLLGVAPAAGGRGLGGRLLAASVCAATERAAAQIRALVRCGNLPMERLCERHGFARSPRSFALYIGDPQPVASEKRSHSARLVVVETLAYAGLWLEGDLSQAAIDDARGKAHSGGMSTIGTLIPAAAYDAARLLEANSFREIGEYHWWTLNRRTDRS